MADILSLEDGDGLRCVDILVRPDGLFGFREFRRDPEDGGRWSLVADYLAVGYASRDDALTAARRTIPWLGGAVAEQARPAQDPQP